MLLVTYYARNYAGIIGASLMMSSITAMLSELGWTSLK